MPLKNGVHLKNGVLPENAIGREVQLISSITEHKGKYFKILELIDDKIVVVWQNIFYEFYPEELEFVKNENK